MPLDKIRERLIKQSIVFYLIFYKWYHKGSSFESVNKYIGHDDNLVKGMSACLAFINLSVFERFRHAYNYRWTWCFVKFVWGGGGVLGGVRKSRGLLFSKNKFSELFLGGTYPFLPPPPSVYLYKPFWKKSANLWLDVGLWTTIWGWGGQFSISVLKPV